MDEPVRTLDSLHSNPRTGLTSRFSRTCTEITREEEEHCQLPLDENVPQGGRTPQEGRCPGLNKKNRIPKITVGHFWLYLQEVVGCRETCLFWSLFIALFLLLLFFFTCFLFGVVSRHMPQSGL